MGTAVSVYEGVSEMVGEFVSDGLGLGDCVTLLVGVKLGVAVLLGLCVGVSL
jgi:hypothetical protein